MNNKVNEVLNQFPDISIRLDKKQLINQLRAMTDTYIELWINTKNLTTLTIKDRYNINKMTTKN